MGPIGIWEIVAICIVALIVLGPRRLPEAARSLGKLIRQLKSHSDSVKAELRDAIDTNDLEEITSMQRDLKDAMDFRSLLAAPGLRDISSTDSSQRPRGNHSTKAGRPAQGADTHAPGLPDVVTRRLPGSQDAVANDEPGANDEPAVTRRLPDVDQQT